jgi:hypothetical protein
MSPWTPLPPRCPHFDDANPSLFERYSEFIHDHGENGAEGRSIEWRQAAFSLASDLHSEAVSLGMSKAYESSDDIYWLEQCAAIVSLVAFGRRSPDFEKYEAAVHYYRAFACTAERVAAFDIYVQGA